MEKIWCCKCPETLSENDKNTIVRKVFDAVVDNEMCEDIGEEIVDFVTKKGYVYQEEIESVDVATKALEDLEKLIYSNTGIPKEFF